MNKIKRSKTKPATKKADAMKDISVRIDMPFDEAMQRIVRVKPPKRK